MSRKIEEQPELPPMRKRILKGVYKTLISSLILLVVLVGAGVVYTMLGDRNTPVTSLTVASTTAPVSQEIKPAKPGPNAPEGVAVEMVSSPIGRGSAASITIHTNAESTCKIAVIYMYDYEKTQTPVADPALAPKVADEFGMVNWDWTVSPAAQLGKGRVEVTCTYHGRTAKVDADLQVTQ